MPKQIKKNQKSSEVRVIAGHLRGSKIHIPNLQDLRPTPSKTRETIFNWLQTKIINSHCLDLFAGSGALGIEALSRGAKKVVFIEKDATAKKNLQLHLEKFKLIEKSALYLTTAQSYLQTLKTQVSHLENIAHTEQKFDVIFMDPPFREISNHSKLLETILEIGILKADGFIVCECAEHSRNNLQLNPCWDIYREAKAGLSNVLLLRNYTQDIQETSEE